MKANRFYAAFILAAFLIVSLTACGGAQEAAGTNAMVYVSQSVPFTSPLDDLETVCISGDSLYLLGVIRDSASGYGANNSDNKLFSLVRVPLDGGKAETLDKFQPAQVPLEGETRQSSTSGYLRPGADGTLWLTEGVSYWSYDLPEGFDVEKDADEIYKFISDRGRSLFLRHLDGEGNELARFEFPALEETFGVDRIYDLWTDGAGTFFVNTGEAVVLLDGDGTVRAVLEGTGMDGGRFVPLSDGRTAILGTVQSVDGSATLLRVIDMEAGAWAADAFSVPYDASCFQSGDGEDILFYYKRGDGLYAWKKGAEEPERVMSWSESGMDATQLAAFSFLSDGRLAASAYDGYDFDKSLRLSLLTPTDASSMPERTVLTLAAYYLDPEIRAEIATFNNTSSSCYISATEYLTPSSQYTTADTDAEFEQATLRMVTDLTVGKIPDIIYLNNAMPARRMEAQGILEDLWPFIEADPELGRDALMTRPLEAMEYKGGLYRIGAYFGIDTLIGRRDVVGDRLTWTYDDLWAVYDTMPAGSAITHTDDCKRDMLARLVENGAERFVDWENGVSFFDGEEFRSLLEFCNRFPDERDPLYPPGNMRVSYSLEDQVAISQGEQMLLNSSVGSFLGLGVDKCLLGGDISFVGWPNEAGQVGSVFHLAGGTALAITAASEHKEAAWSFLREKLLPHEEVSLKGKYGMTNAFPINRSDFERMAELAMTPEMEEKAGVLQEVPKLSRQYVSDGIEIDVTVNALTQEEYDQIMELYNAAEGIVDYDVNLMNIITEQAGAYFAGDRSLDDTVAAIQSRVGLYLAELQ